MSPRLGMDPPTIVEIEMIMHKTSLDADITCLICL